MHLLVGSKAWRFMKRHIFRILSVQLSEMHVNSHPTYLMAVYSVLLLGAGT